MLLASSCTHGSRDVFDPEKPDTVDPSLNLTRDDYRNLDNLQSYKKPGAESGGAPAAHEPPIPALAEILAMPKPPKLGQTQLVSIAVTDDVPLKDVLIELARLANVDIEVDAGITGGINFRAKDRPFNEVIDRIADLAGLRYTMKDNILRVERDTPFVKIYSLDFLNMDRNATGSVNISTNVLSSSSGASGGSGSGSTSSAASSSGGSAGGSSSGSGSGLNTGSSEAVTTTANSDFWKQFEESIKQILAYQPARRVSNIDLAQQPNAPSPASEAAGKAAAAPAAAAPAAAAAPSSGAAGTPIPGDFYIINRQASTLTISATQKQHDLIKEFLRRVQANASAQVLIEAKIVEVTLNDQFQSGIDWTKLGNGKISFASKFGGVTDTSNVATFSSALGTRGFDLTSAVALAQMFGTTRTLSSPRLHAINNQQAILTFAENQVYFSITATQTEITNVNGSTSPGPLTVNSTAHTVPIGIIMTLQPSINTETGEITLNIRPTLSRITGQVNDPAISYTLALAAQQGVDVTGITAAVPIIEVRELDSILKLKSGQVMVIGGLMQNVADSTDNGLPGLGSIPFVSTLFRGTSKKNNMSELVIFIRATIVDSGGHTDEADRDVYQKFTKDPRPLNF